MDNKARKEVLSIAVAMSVFAVLTVSAKDASDGLIAWWRVYVYNQKKGSRRIMSHILGFFVGLFPAYFVLHSSAMTFLASPNGVEPSIGDLITVWAICLATIFGVFYMTSRPIPKQDGPKTLFERLAMRSDGTIDEGSPDDHGENLKRDEGF